MNDTTDAVPSAQAIAGEFTIFTAALYKQTLLEIIATADDGEVDIDLTAVSEIDSAGLQLMVMAKQEAAARGKELNFACSRVVTDLIEMCDLSTYFEQSLLTSATL